MFGWFRRGKVTGWKLGPVEVIRTGFRQWKVIQWSPTDNQFEETGTLSDYSPNQAKAWGEKRKKDLEFLWGIQAALNQGKLSPKQYYQIIARYKEGLSRCKEPHVHSMQCQYHDYH